MNVVLINPPADKLYLRDMYSSTMSKGRYCWPPVDLLVLSGIISERHNVTLFDANALGFDFEKAIKRVEECSPHVVIFMAGSSSRENDLYFAREIKFRFPDVMLVGNGGFLYHNAIEEMRRNAFLDAIIMNFTTNDILDFIERKDGAGLHNLAYRRNADVIVAEKRTEKGYFGYPLPKHEQLPLNRYGLSHGKGAPLTSLLSSYGCVGGCSFCVSADIPYRLRAIDNVIAELEYVKRLGVREIFFRDAAFGAVRGHLIDLCAEMVKVRLDLSWVCDIRADSLDGECLRIMKKAGCHTVHMGVESVQQKTIRKYSKKITKQKIIDSFKLCDKVGIRTVGYFIIGLPGETKKDIVETIDFAIQLNCDFASFNFAIPIYGTELRKECIDKEYINCSLDSFDGSFPVIAEPGLITIQELTSLKRNALKKFYFRFSYILKRLKGVTTFYEIKMLLLEFFNLIIRFKGNCGAEKNS